MSQDRPPGTVLVTGASGNVGRFVVEALLRRGVPVRAGVRDLAQGDHLVDGTAVALDFHRPETFEPALRDVEGLFLMRPPPIARVGPTLNRLVDAAAAGGVRRIALLSVIGAGRNPVVPHHRVEQHLRRTPVDWTFLRPSFFAQNLGDSYRRDICEDGRIYVPAGAGRVAFVDVRDVADVAARALTEPGVHAGRAYDLTGPQALGFADVATLLGRALGRVVRFEPATVPGYARHLRSRGVAVPQIAVQTVLHAGLRLGQAARVDPTLAQLLGRPAGTLQRYVDDHVALWR